MVDIVQLKRYEVGDAEEVDLRLTLVESGQSFRWIEADGRFGSVVDGIPVWFVTEGGELVAYASREFDFRHYLGLDLDYRSVFESTRDKETLLPLLERLPGLRVLNQPAWDTLLTFIISANNNVKRIMKTSLSLASVYGCGFNTKWGCLYAMPTPEVLAEVSPEELRKIGTGFRDRYLVEAAKSVRDGFPLYSIASMPYDKAHAKLCELLGVGDKVADCVLLFGCRHYEAIPIDVWMERAMRDVLGVEAPNRRKVAELSRERIGPYAGIIQQFLFHAARVPQAV